jgi:hypothetical protein
LIVATIAHFQGGFHEAAYGFQDAAHWKGIRPAQRFEIKL